jgi:Fe/S biogenesis protein NfuA
MLTFSDRAQEVVRSYLEQSGGELTALRIAARPGSPVAPRFELSLVADGERGDDEREMQGPGFPVFVKEDDFARLEGATIDFVDRVNESGFEVRTVTPSASRAGAPEGEVADRVRQVLDTQVNPAIAAHGGRITLVDVKDTEVFVEMSGGCQGCALSRMTLSQGVERMLRQSIPELTAVHDVTDHDSGVNPYFQH